MRTKSPCSLSLPQGSTELVLAGGVQDSEARRLKAIPCLAILVLRKFPLGLESKLQAWGHRLTTASTVAAALDVLQRNQCVNLMFAEWCILQARKRQFFSLARRLQSSGSLQCVAVTGGDAEKDGWEALESGADASLAQGCRPFELFIQLRTAHRLQENVAARNGHSARYMA